MSVFSLNSSASLFKLFEKFDQILKILPFSVHANLLYIKSLSLVSSLVFPHNRCVAKQDFNVVVFLYL